MKRNFLIASFTLLLGLFITAIPGWAIMMYANNDTLPEATVQQEENFDCFPLAIGYEDSQISGYTQVFNIKGPRKLQKLDNYVGDLGPLYVPLKDIDMPLIKVVDVTFGLWNATVHYIDPSDPEAGVQKMTRREFNSTWQNNSFYFGPAATEMKLEFSEGVDLERVQEFAELVSEALEYQIAGDFSPGHRDIPIGLETEVEYDEAGNTYVSLIAQDIDTLKKAYSVAVEAIQTLALNFEGIDDHYLGVTGTICLSSGLLENIIEYLEEEYFPPPIY